MGGAVTNPLANALTLLERRVFSLERRFAGLAALSSKAVKYLYQLLDVEITYDGGSAVADGDVLTYDAALGKWVNAAPAGPTFATIRLSGYEDATYWTEWSEASGFSAMTEDAGAGLSGSDIMAAIYVPATGIYHVSASVDSSDAVALQVSVDDGGIGWSHVGAAECRPHGSIFDDGTDGASGALDFPIVGGSRIFIRVTTSGSADWWLAAHWVAPLDIEPGTCGA